MKTKSILAAAFVIALAFASTLVRAADPVSVTAIDILLEPDATMLQHAADNNAELLKFFPKGFPLDATHTPHITMLQCFVSTVNLEKVYAAAGQGSTEDVNATFLQPFVSFTTKKFTTFGLNSESTYDWSESQWTVPLNLMVSQLVKIGKMPIQFQVGGRYYAEKPEGGPDWGLRFAVTLLFPK